MKKTTFCLILLALICANVHAIGKKYDGDNYEIKPTSVNTAAYEYGISFYRNNTVAFFKTDSTVGVINDKKMSKDGVSIYTAVITSSGDLANPEFSEELMDLGVSGTFAYDKKKDKIYFSRYNKLNNVYQLFESTYSDGKWESPQIVEIESLTPKRMNMSTIVNANWDYLDKGASIIQPTLAKDGNRMYFASNLKGGEGKMDIWYIDYDGTSWSVPVNVGKGVNTSGNEQYPYVVGDSVLYYTSNVSGEGKYDLFAARLIDNPETDTIPYENLGTFFNTADNEYNLIANNKTVYFIAENDSLNDQIMYLKERLIIIPEIIASVEPAPLKEIVEFNHVLFLFDFDKSNLKKEFASQIDQIIEEMQLFPDQKFEIAGHTDERGSDQYNDKLSMRRAKTVQDILLKRGVSKDKLVVKAYGKREPVVKDAQTEEDHAKNRRVEINFYNENK